MTIGHNSESSLWVPDPTQDPSLTPSLIAFSETSSSTWSWTETTYPMSTPATDSQSSLTSILALTATSSTSTASTSTASWPQKSGANSARQRPTGASVKFKTAHIVAACIGSFLALLAMAGFVYLLIRRRRRFSHQRLYDDPDEKHHLNFASRTSFDDGGKWLGAAVHGRDRGGSFGEGMPSRRVLDRSYYNARRSLSDGGFSSTTPLLQPPLSHSDGYSPEQESHPTEWGLSNAQKSHINQLISEEFPEPTSPTCLPRYSRTLPIPPIFRLPRPLPRLQNPRPLLPQRRSNSIQVRMENKPPLISNSTTWPLSSSPPTFNLSSSPPSNLSPSSLSSPSDTLRTTEPIIPEKLRPLQPQRRTEENIIVTPSSRSLSNGSSGAVTPYRPTVSFKDIEHPNANSTKKFTKMKLRRNQAQPPKRGQSGLTSESFRCAGEKAIYEDTDSLARESVGASPPSDYARLSSTKLTPRGALIDT